MDATRKCKLLTLGPSSTKLLQPLFRKVDLDQFRVAIHDRTALLATEIPRRSHASDTLSCVAVDAVQSTGDLLASLI